MSIVILHCWYDFEDGYYREDGTWDPEWVPGHTCMLLDGHDGPHEPTSDRNIGVTLAGEASR